MARARSGQISEFHTPSVLIHEPTMKASATPHRSRRLSGVQPEPTSTGSRVALRTARRSSADVWRPVASPVTTTPSAPKNSAARAVSARSTSAVMAWLECFFLMSAYTATPAARIRSRWRRSSPASDSISPSSATWPNTNPSARTKHAPATAATLTAARLAPARIWIPSGSIVAARTAHATAVIPATVSLASARFR